MYIWMMLAAFIVMLATFNLSPRSDLQSKHQVPLAEASITKFLIQHDAAVRHAKYNKALKSLNHGLLTGCNDSNQGQMCKYFPVGFNYEENLYYSGIYCLNSAVYSTTTNPDTGDITKTIETQEGVNEASCNATSGSEVYVISYGRVPQRWKNVSSNRILGDYYTAMHSRIAVGASCGIVVPKKGDDEKRNPLGSEYVIEGIDVQNESIPKYLLDDSEFNEVCTKEVDGEFPCIIYVTAL